MRSLKTYAGWSRDQLIKELNGYRARILRMEERQCGREKAAELEILGLTTAIRSALLLIAPERLKFLPGLLWSMVDARRAPQKAEVSNDE
ncbi:hypothetical protein D3C84_822370 [compost metagenome]